MFVYTEHALEPITIVRSFVTFTNLSLSLSLSLSLIIIYVLHIGNSFERFTYSSDRIFYLFERFINSSERIFICSKDLLIRSNDLLIRPNGEIFFLFGFSTPLHGKDVALRLSKLQSIPSRKDALSPVLLKISQH